MLQPIRAFLLFSAVCMCLVGTGCSKSKTKALTFPIGEKVQVGKLSYQVLEANWQAEVPGLKQTPKNRILQIHVAITNSAPEEIAMPMLRVIDAAGNEIGEITEVDNHPKWLGMIRRVQPALTEEGIVFFDVPVGSYKLEVVDNSIADNEQVAFIEIPANLAPPPSMPAAKGV